ncbi:MAG: enoyl-CoA hydratase-related protein [Pseudomonadota bacterium]
MAEVEVGRDGAVMTITLNRPEVFNAFNADLHARLADALREAGDPEVRAVVITGAGRGFCAGQDLTEFRESPDIGQALRGTYHPNVRAIRGLEKPVIAAVNGAAAGAGLSLACACDLRVASDAAVFAPGFIGIGLVPDAGGAYFLARILGVPRAFELMASGRRLTAAEAQAWGLVSEVFEASTFAEQTAAYAAEWAARPTRGVALTKRLFDEAAGKGLEETLALEAQLQEEATRTGDFAEGVAAFLEKRPPAFRGR